MGTIDPDREYHIGLKKGDVGDYILLPGDPARAEKIAGYFDEAEEVNWVREYRTFTGTYNGIPVSVMSTGIGCPSMAIAVEELVKVGAPTMLRVGTAGSMQRKVGLGSITISTGAVRVDGTTKEYVPVEYPAVPDFEVTAALRSAAEELDLDYHTGIVHCKDAFYTEGNDDLPLAVQQRELWDTWYKANVLSTSMESSALFVLSSIKDVPCGEVLANIGLTYADEPIVAKEGVDEAIRCALKAIESLEKKTPGS